MPVIACVSSSKNGKLFNVNADTLAGSLAARLQAMGYPALYYENTEGGHSNDSDPILNSERWARHYVYLARRLGLPE